MTSITDKIRKINYILFQYKKRGLYPLYKALYFWIKNRDVSYSYIKQKEWSKYKTSDTVFLFGSGPSLNNLTEEQWKIIKENDSFGLNFAFLTKEPMTYFLLGYEPTSNKMLSKAFSPDIRQKYNDSLWFVPNKCMYRLYHPRIIPEFFPFKANLGLYESPPSININEDRPFNVNDFRVSIIYRGIIGFGLHLCDILGYKKIVLLGVNLHTYKHFFDDFEVMRKQREEYYKIRKPKNTFDDLLPNKKSKIKPMEEYYYALNELYFQPKGVQLYVGNKNNILSPRIPMFPDFV